MTPGTAQIREVATNQCLTQEVSKVKTVQSMDALPNNRKAPALSLKLNPYIQLTM